MTTISACQKNLPIMSRLRDAGFRTKAVPEGVLVYDPETSMPVVIFYHDGSVISDESAKPMLRNLGTYS
jgi:hypothetical protein